MHIVRYRHYPQSDLSAALDRLTNMRAEMDRVFESTGSFSASPAPLSRWNPAINVYQDKDRFTVVVELPGLKKEEIEISLHDDTLTIAGERKTRSIQRVCYRRRRRQNQNRSKSP
jgi:HSP20 family protein